VLRLRVLRERWHDADGDGLELQCELSSAPPGSEWLLEDAETTMPLLRADRPGPYRIRLVATDSTGQTSRPPEVLVVAGDVCENGPLLGEDSPPFAGFPPGVYTWYVIGP
jgi:hypothetical protein